MKHGIIIAGSGRGLYFADLLARTPGLKESCSVKAVVDIRKENHDALRTRLNESGLTETKILTTLPEALEALPRSTIGIDRHAEYNPCGTGGTVSACRTSPSARKTDCRGLG